jgi:hypothetical protein
MLLNTLSSQWSTVKDDYIDLGGIRLSVLRRSSEPAWAAAMRFRIRNRKRENMWSEET